MVSRSTLRKINVLSPIATAYNFTRPKTRTEKYIEYLEESNKASAAAGGMAVTSTFLTALLFYFIPMGLCIYFAYKNWDVIPSNWKIGFVLCMLFLGPIISGIVLYFAIRKGTGAM